MSKEFLGLSTCEDESLMKDQWATIACSKEGSNSSIAQAKGWKLFWSEISQAGMVDSVASNARPGECSHPRCIETLHAPCSRGLERRHSTGSDQLAAFSAPLESRVLKVPKAGRRKSWVSVAFRYNRFGWCQVIDILF